MADPRLPNLTVQQLEYLVAAAASLTRAAAATGLGVTPSALTQGLADLPRQPVRCLSAPASSSRAT